MLGLRNKECKTWTLRLVYPEFPSRSSNRILWRGYSCNLHSGNSLRGLSLCSLIQGSGGLKGIDEVVASHLRLSGATINMFCPWPKKTRPFLKYHNDLVKTEEQTHHKPASVLSELIGDQGSKQVRYGGTLGDF